MLRVVINIATTTIVLDSRGDLIEVFNAAKLLYPKWTSITITIVNTVQRREPNQ